MKENQQKLRTKCCWDQLSVQHSPISLHTHRNYRSRSKQTESLKNMQHFPFELRSLVSFLCSAPSIHVCDFVVFFYVNCNGEMAATHKMTALCKCDNTKTNSNEWLHSMHGCACVGALVNIEHGIGS